MFLIKFLIFIAVGYIGYELIYWLTDSPKFVKFFFSMLKDTKFGALLIGGILIVILAISLIASSKTSDSKAIYFGLIVGVTICSVKTQIKDY